MADAPQHIDTTDVRAGVTPHMTRPILAWGLTLTIIAFVLIYFLWN